MNADVVVAGAGPAGSALARRLALLGFDVVLLARPNTAPRFAESLAPGVRIHLDTLGIPIPPGRLCTTRIVDWRGAVESHEMESLIVDRAVFDEHLLRAAVDAGVRVMNADTGVDASFFADATGRAGLLRRPRRYESPRTFAIRCRWNGLDAPDEMRIATLPHGWMWGIAANGGYETAHFVDREGVSRPPEGLFPFLERSPDVIHRCDATPFMSLEPVTDDSILVGDAACAIDPLSSSGIQAALGGAITASIVINTILRRPEHRAAAMQFYSASIADRFARHARWTAAHYAESTVDSAFWQSRAAPRDVTPATHARPVVIGDFVVPR